MDNPSTESSTSPLDVNSAASVFAELLEPQEVKEDQEQDTPVEAQEAEAEPVESEGEQPEEDNERVTIEVDGKTVELTKAELAEAYKNGLRQSDYMKKTMEVAEARKAAEAEIAQARQERESYANNLTKIAAQLEGALEQQSQINWQALLESDPVEYLKQQHLYQQRQAALQANWQEQSKLAEQAKAEQAQQRQTYLAQQQEALLAKLPDWKDESKAQAEKTAIAQFLKESGFEDELISQITDHRQVLIARDAMLYRQMMQKASAAAKKVAVAPQRVVKPGVSESNRPDGRSSAMQRLGKTGRVEDAAAVFASFL